MTALRTLLAGLVLAGVVVAGPAGAAPQGLGKLNHIVVIYLENRSFDNLYALFPGADGLEGARAAPPQVDLAGKPYAILPPAVDTEARPPRPDPRFPAALANGPFALDAYVPQDQKTPDLVHRFYQAQSQIDGGRNDKFAAISDAQGLVMGYHDTRGTRLWRYAQEYTLADRFFQGAFGGSFLNHFWLVCACTPRFADAPAAIKAKLDDQGRVVVDGAVTPDGYAVNTLQSVYTPHRPKADTTRLLPPQTLPTIGDRLADKGVSWAWYSGGWDRALAGTPSADFQYHHQPFAYFAKYADGTPAKAAHLRDEAKLFADLTSGTLPAVVFYKPVGAETQHSGYANIAAGDAKAAQVIEAIQASDAWADTAVIVTYDESGGWWDHVGPPAGDRWGPGVRVPALVISPFAKRGFVDHTVYDTTSILKLIETRFGLAPLGERDAHAADLTAAFDFGAP